MRYLLERLKLRVGGFLCRSGKYSGSGGAKADNAHINKDPEAAIFEECGW